MLFLYDRGGLVGRVFVGGLPPCFNACRAQTVEALGLKGIGSALGDHCVTEYKKYAGSKRQCYIKNRLCRQILAIRGAMTPVADFVFLVDKVSRAS